MSARHTRAVQKRNGDYDDTTDFLIMQVIATDIGWHNEPARTSQRGIAERVGVHYNTVNTRVAKLIEQGHLVGHREGKYLHYSLPFDCDKESESSQPAGTLSQSPTGDSDNGDCDNHNRLSQIEERLSQLEGKIITILENIVTVDQTGTMTKDIEDISEDKESIYIPPQEYLSLEEENTKSNMVTAISKQVKDTYWAKTEEDFHSAAAALIEMGATEETVNGFADWWGHNGHYKGKPALKSFMQNYTIYADGVQTTKPAQENDRRTRTQWFPI